MEILQYPSVIYLVILTANEAFLSTLLDLHLLLISFTIFHTIYKWCIEELISFLFMAIWKLVTCLFELLLFRLSNHISSSLSSKVVFVLSVIITAAPGTFYNPISYVKWVRLTQCSILISVLHCEFINVSLKILIFSLSACLPSSNRPSLPTQTGMFDYWAHSSSISFGPVEQLSK